ncbi:MAG: hypothetical protein ACI32F_08010 [Allobaculum sp.]
MNEKKIYRYPIKRLASDIDDFFHIESYRLLSLDDCLDSWLDNETLYHQVRDILEYRTVRYYTNRYLKTLDRKH